MITDSSFLKVSCHTKFRFAEREAQCILGECGPLRSTVSLFYFFYLSRPLNAALSTWFRREFGQALSSIEYDTEVVTTFKHRGGADDPPDTALFSLLSCFNTKNIYIYKCTFVRDFCVSIHP